MAPKKRHIDAGASNAMGGDVLLLRRDITWHVEDGAQVRTSTSILVCSAQIFAKKQKDTKDTNPSEMQYKVALFRWYVISSVHPGMSFDFGIKKVWLVSIRDALMFTTGRPFGSVAEFYTAIWQLECRE